MPDPPNAELPLFGGAAFERVMAEFQTAVNALGFPGGTPCLKCLCLASGRVTHQLPVTDCASRVTAKPKGALRTGSPESGLTSSLPC